MDDTLADVDHIDYDHSYDTKDIYNYVHNELVVNINGEKNTWLECVVTSEILCEFRTVFGNVTV